MQNIKLGHLYRVYLLYGEEKYLKEMYLKKLVKLAAPQGLEEFNLHRFDAGQMEVDDLIESCEALPMMAQQRCVVVEKFDFESLNAQDKAKVTELLEDPPETTVLLLTKRDSSDLSRFIRSRLEPKGCTVSKACCDLLIERCEKNMLTLSGELEKLAAYVQGEWNATPQTPVELTEQMIETVTCKTVNASVYDLARAILADRFEKAMRIVEDLLYLRYQPTAILAALSGAYLDLYIAKTAREMGQGEEAIKQNFSYKGRDFVVRNSLRDCSRYSLRVLERSVICLAQTDHRMKSSRADPTILLEQAVTQLFVLASEDK